MGRSIGAVVLGFLYALAAIGLSEVVLWFLIPEEPVAEGADPVPGAHRALTVICVFTSAIIAGFMAGHFARHSELAHGLAVGAVLVVLLAITSLVIDAEAPPWYQLALPGVALPGALLGAGLRTRVRRPPPPAPPPSG